MLASGCSSKPPIAATATGPLPSLSQLYATHPTDKCADHHNYVELYDVYFQPKRQQVKRLLEIGVLRGHSLRLWEAYFPTALIYDVDIEDASAHDTDRITTGVADQASRKELGALVESHGANFDIILDDGGHTMKQQQVSFGFLFQHVAQGGMYIIENIHTSFPRGRRRLAFAVEKGRANTTYAMIDRFVRTGVFESQYLSSTATSSSARRRSSALVSSQYNSPAPPGGPPRRRRRSARGRAPRPKTGAGARSESRRGRLSPG